jgi:hypothetical protein
MRHFLRVTLAPGALTRRVFTRSAVAFLVAFRGAAQRFTPANLRAALRTVAVAAVAICADAHLLRTTRAAIQPITLFACPHEPGTRHWTTPRTAGIKAKGTRPSYARDRRRPGVLSRNGPGLRLSGVWTLSIADSAIEVRRTLSASLTSRCVTSTDSVWFNQSAPLATRTIGLQALFTHPRSGE